MATSGRLWRRTVNFVETMTAETGLFIPNQGPPDALVGRRRARPVITLFGKRDYECFNNLIANDPRRVTSSRGVL